ncbi:MAG: hypothetical protein EBR79_02035 [Proteobacteria bacterium]|nr:hypothetical protein [Pseudomonadota bacterium]NBX86502.1 hypothetical protein [Pseudomonadota bacterium]
MNTSATTTTLSSQGDAIRKSTLAMSLLSILPHLLCCGIPAVAAMIALGGTVGLGAALMANPFYAFVDAYHTELLILAVVGVVISGVLNLIAYRMDCRAAANSTCTHAACAPKKSKAFRIFIISVVLLALDVAWFMTEEYVLGLHHHGSEAHGHELHGHEGHQH